MVDFDKNHLLQRIKVGWININNKVLPDTNGYLKNPLKDDVSRFAEDAEVFCDEI